MRQSTLSRVAERYWQKVGVLPTLALYRTLTRLSSWLLSLGTESHRSLPCHVAPARACQGWDYNTAPQPSLTCPLEPTVVVWIPPLAWCDDLERTSVVAWSGLFK